jgi:hypothetical protein
MLKFSPVITKKYAGIPLNSSNNKMSEAEYTYGRIQGLMSGWVSSTEVLQPKIRMRILT